MPAVINEFVFNHDGTDTNEFVEIFGDPDTDYSNLWLIQIEGDGSGAGTIDTAIQLGTTDANGFWTTGFLNNEFENGTVTALLVEDFTGSEGDDVDTNNDGTLDSPPWASVVDSVAVTDGGGGDQTYSASVLGSDVDGASRIPDGTDSDTAADWVNNEFTSPADPSAAVPGEARNTPGASNIQVELLPAVPATIMQIQGAGHTSVFNGQLVVTTGIVTALAGNGFFIQDPDGDGDIATSDAIFISSGETVAVGDAVEVTGLVEEDLPGGAATNLTTTQIAGNPSVTIESSGNALPASTILGAGGRVPPQQVVEDDAFGSFDPTTDGLDYFESLEGMLVTVPDAVATSATSRFGETWVVADGGDNVGPEGLNPRGGIDLEENDINPERIQIQTSSGLGADVGDGLGDVTGVLGYNFGNYEVRPTGPVVVTDGGLTAETSALAGTENQLTVASYNVLNLDGSGGDAAQMAILGQQIANNLGGPDIIALQEIQDNNGITNDGTTDASQTLQQLVDAIALAGGPTYAFFDVAPVDGTQGGAPGGNIRVAYLYNPDRVELVDGSVEALELDAFAGSRIPLQARFDFEGNEITLINNHFSSKFGSTPVYGAIQPFINAGADEREAQAQAINDHVDGLKADDPDAKVIVLGDLNDFQFASPQPILTGEADGNQVLFDQIEELEDDEVYTFIFEGNSQVLDHFLVTENLTEDIEFDIVHVNVDFDDGARNGTETGSDHEPILGRLSLDARPDGIEEDGTRSADLIEGTAGHDTLSGERGDDTLMGGSGDDEIDGGRDDDLVDGGTGADTIEGGRGEDTIIGASGDDSIDGGRDEDLISGGSGEDTIEGGRGDDTIDGGDDDDVIDGGRDDDLIAGGEGDDDIVGGRGDDTLEGGEGDDTLEGGRDDDVFVFESGSGVDTINDFEPGDDLIRLDGFSIADFDDVLDAAEDDGDDAVITLDEDGGDEIRLIGVNKDDLSSDDFMISSA
ncbi:endonuclease [Pelagibius litoralis]|uniref:Endonuclease n=1 Tax=Pelagibius litoralis TaxID=374515 RepID=A0A967C1M2_9PROT|nr:endonuclease/exonuclease/phosphatase family protein [Pelagibius litoralis]NIA67456.1 endonuclease [Pelagibius litoralis]